jgi:hypothetical protein
MNRKKFFALASTSILGIAILKANPLNLFTSKKDSEKDISVKVKINPLAVSREKTGNKNG